MQPKNSTITYFYFHFAIHEREYKCQCKEKSVLGSLIFHKAIHQRIIFAGVMPITEEP